MTAQEVAEEKERFISQLGPYNITVIRLADGIFILSMQITLQARAVYLVDAGGLWVSGHLVEQVGGSYLYIFKPGAGNDFSGRA